MQTNMKQDQGQVVALENVGQKKLTLRIRTKIKAGTLEAAPCNSLTGCHC